MNERKDNSIRNRRSQLIRRNSDFPTDRPPYGERVLIIGRLEELGAPRELTERLLDWSIRKARE